MNTLIQRSAAVRLALRLLVAVLRPARFALGLAERTPRPLSVLLSL